MTNGRTFVEKALARAAGVDTVQIGQVVDIRPDVVLSHDNSAAIRRIWLEFNQERVAIPDRLTITLDHAVPAPTTKHAQNHAEIRTFVREQGIRRFWEIGRGICHQVLSEEAVVLPGRTILGADSHTTHFGWLGAFGAGIGRSEVAVLWATGELWMRVPETISVRVDGEWPAGVTTKDFALRLIGDLGADGGLYAAIEFSGTAIETLSIDARMVLPNMMAEFGAKSAYIAPDKATLDYLMQGWKRYGQWGGHRSHRAPPVARELGRLDQDDTVSDAQDLATEWFASMERDCLFPDKDARYAAVHHYQAHELEPYIACPHSVDRVVPLSEVAGTPVQQAFLGTCTNGRLEDIAAAAEIVRGHKVAQGTRMIVIPASSAVLTEALRLGYIEALTAAGAVIGVPGCGPCMGNHMGVPAPDEVTISSANRNFRGRMGTAEADIYLSSPAVVAASAIAGRIADPRAVTSTG